jgi:chemotaxis protein CheD
MSGAELLVRVADLNVGGAGDTLLTVGLGSCVAIVLHDAEACVAGMAHVLLPAPALSRRQENPAKCPQTAVPALLERMAQRGAHPRRITARITGGASMFGALAPPGTVQMGERNVVASREALRTAGLPLIGEDVGSDYGRTVRVHAADGRMEISSVMHGIRIL